LLSKVLRQLSQRARVEIGQTTPLATPGAIMPKEKSPPPPWPFFVHNNGQYCKKIGGKHVYFGTDYHAALRKYYAYLEGPPSSVKDSIKKYLADLKALGRSQRHIKTMEWTLNKFAEKVGENRLMKTLKPEDFQKWRVELKTTNGPVSLTNHMRRVKALFNWAADPARKIINSLPPKTCLQRPSREEIRKDRKKRGSKMFTPDELKLLIQNSGPTMRAMILLALNGGLGPQDLALLRTTNIKGKWLVYPRPKTGIDRIIPLWKETRQAIDAVIRPNDPVVFRTKQGYDWLPKSKMCCDSPITQKFTKLCQGLKIHKTGRGFYSLRHVFATVASGTKDRDAVESILGHVPDSKDVLRTYYIEKIDTRRLIAVVQYVRKWLRLSKFKTDPFENLQTPKTAGIVVNLPVSQNSPIVNT
jgi:integrase